VDGILVQLPLPPQIRAEAVLDAVDPAKDVDGFHPVNAGLLATGRPRLVPCTPRGVMHLLAEAGVALPGARVKIIGRSTIVGRPLAQLLLAADATVTVLHSRTRDLPAECRRAEVLIAAAGRPELVRGDWVSDGAVIVDVGINRLADGRLVGDVAFDEAAARAEAITPVPGGVGPMTIACLLENTLDAAIARRGVS
jgi:methylenetetrahydrofolate dehydrogenase (NADP+)/methenyltetrahydrofolate cyclohydrolase